jgi:coenzyme F420-reducing hydrogenase delta subunit
VNPQFILKALQEGADGVLVSGCHPGDCHYLEGNYYARRKFATMLDLLEYIGLEKGRVRFSWVSAAEGGKFAEVVKEVTNGVKEVKDTTQFLKKREWPNE